jgi:hypothetical protein
VNLLHALFVRATFVTLALGPLSACSASSPDVVPLTASGLADAEARWEAAAPDSYRLSVRLKTARMEAVVYDLVVQDGGVLTAKRNGQATSPELARDYAVSGLFRLLRSELRITEPAANGLPNAKAELFVRFEPQTGRLQRYRRATTRRATGLAIEVLEYTAGSARQSAG